MSGLDLRDGVQAAEEATPVLVVGAGGLGAEVRDTLASLGLPFAGFLDDDTARPHVLGPAESSAVLDGHSVIFAIGDPVSRFSVASRFSRFDRWAVVIHPTAVVSPSAFVGPGTYVGALAYVGPNAAIGQHVIVNVHAEVGHDANVDSFVTLSPRATLNGAVSLGTGCFFGTAASAEPGTTIGPWSKVAAKSHVTTDCKEGSLVQGNPARGRQMFRAPGLPTDARRL